jgi:hypothetical protein
MLLLQALPNMCDCSLAIRVLAHVKLLDKETRVQRQPTPRVCSSIPFFHVLAQLLSSLQFSTVLDFAPFCLPCFGLFISKSGRKGIGG